MDACDLDFVDCANVPGPLDWLAFILGGLGIGFTIWQLLRSRGALNAARKALEATKASLVKNQLVAVLPAFTEISARIDDTLRRDDRVGLEQALARFSERAHEAAMLLRETPGDFDRMERKMMRAVETATVARGHLFYDAQSTLEIADGAAAAIRSLTLEIHGVATQLRNDPGGTTDA